VIITFQDSSSYIQEAFSLIVVTVNVLQTRWMPNLSVMILRVKRC